MTACAPAAFKAAPLVKEYSLATQQQAAREIAECPINQTIILMLKDCKDLRDEARILAGKPAPALPKSAPPRKDKK